ncbi:mycofactocin biosynthesis peptidyl-dipeptidase MftE [Nocardiopsis potens]|uniref:mycofactocin biosynthesis peptidyl-dipeptidase MftE n=1 Tax=Nocardiopsis potens TaxID=1246458 RepID=UPI00034A9951|nr:mycofactocin biosynthesis peptidyl-dipeptidase MftE [Nocardiopsis potens]
MSGTEQAEPAAGRMASPEAAGLRVLLVPLGAVEQHGPHLPLDTDVRIAEHVAYSAARGLPDLRVAVAPALPYGASGEHRTFPGTLWLAVETVTAALLDLARAARPWAGHTVFVSGHGGNAEPASAALRVLRTEAPGSASAWFPRAGVLAAAGRAPDAHAGRTETSMLLAIAPDLVRTDLAEPGTTAPLADLLPAIRAGSIADASRNGVLGDPTGATAAEGRALLHLLTEDLQAHLTRTLPR